MSQIARKVGEHNQINQEFMADISDLYLQFLNVF